MIKKYKLFLESKKDIDAICKKYQNGGRIRNYTINPDGTVDVDGDVYLDNKRLTKLPLKFGKVTGDFDCSNNQLTTLEGAPTEVGGGFYCVRNQLTTLEGSPNVVCGDFLCSGNQLMDFRGFPEFFENGISLSDNPIEEIYYLFNNIKCIYWINEFDVIDGNKVIEDRLIDVFNQLGLEPPKTIKLKNYTLI